ncbi:MULTISPECIES: acyltransferase [unclassified Exiguobacterium]|uniref:acyltransferase n=1 Tax=unclassified Exiguobacterium TaxID=2644629 RepID=UPI001BE51A71|nr:MULTISPECIES: acyltransferase [unclassified Exiguobacterium]
MICKIFNKIKNELAVKNVQNKYKTKSAIKIYGEVRLDNPNIIFGNNVSLYPGVQIWGNGMITLGDNVAIGKDTIIFAQESMTIGNDTSIAAQCYIIDSDHETSRSQLIREQPMQSESIFIGQDVWLGAGCKVLKGSYISDGSVIGAMSLIKGYTSPYSISVGIPAKKISDRK